MNYKLGVENKIRYNGDTASGLYNLLITHNSITIKSDYNEILWSKTFNSKIKTCKQMRGNFSTVSEQLEVEFINGDTLVYSTVGSLLYDSRIEQGKLESYYEESLARVVSSHDYQPGLYQVTCKIADNIGDYEIFDTRGMCVYTGRESQPKFKMLVLGAELLQIKTNDQLTISDIEIIKVDDEPITYIVGDSTLTNQTLPYWGWPQLLQAKTNRPVVNLAVCGRSTKSFNVEGRYNYLFKYIKAGDRLIIGFGHNDEKDNYFGTTIDEYILNINNLKRACKIRSVRPIITTPIVRRNFIGGKLVETHEPYLSALKNNFAKYIIDTNQFTSNLVTELQEKGSKQLFVYLDAMKIYDDTHTSFYGASQICDFVIKQLKL